MSIGLPMLHTAHVAFCPAFASDLVCAGLNPQLSFPSYIHTHRHTDAFLEVLGHVRMHAGAAPFLVPVL